MGRGHMFQSLELNPRGIVSFRGDQKGKSISSGTIGNCYLPYITNVLLVEGLMHNLLSISQLSDNCYDIIFNKKSCEVVSQKDCSVIFSGKRRTTVTKLDFLI